MPRYVIPRDSGQPEIKRSAVADGRLVERLVSEIEDAYSGRRPQESAWMEGRRQYAAVPESAVRNQPIPNSPNIELPTGALICDSLYAQVSDTLFQATPILSAREMTEQWELHAKAVQRLTDWMVGNEIGLRAATDAAFQDDIQLGTGVLYTPWVRNERHTAIHKIVSEGPRVLAISPEDFLVPLGSRGDHQQDDWVNLRFWYTPGEFKSMAKAAKWNTDGIKPVAMADQTRLYYERISNTASRTPQREQFAVEQQWIFHDYNDEGMDRDLEVTWDRQSRKLLSVGYNRYDYRPVETMRYQIRPHLFWGLGVMEMVQPYQAGGTEILNHFLLNMMIANVRLYMARHGTVDDFTKIWGNRIVGVESTDDIKQLPMGEVYPSALAGLSQILQLAERRVGVTGDFTSGNPASRILGTRTPGITAMTALQSVNRRFAPAFDGMRLNTSAAVRQCLWRYAEQVRSGESGERTRGFLTRLLGEVDARLVIELFRQDDFERCVSVEFTAVSASVNKDSDRQNAMLLMQQQGAYIQQIVQAVAMMTQPGTSPIVMDVAQKAMKALNYTTDLYLRTFEGVRNPSRLLIDVSAEIDAAKQQAEEQQAEESLMGQLMQQFGGGAAPMGGPEPGVEDAAMLPEEPPVE